MEIQKVGNVTIKRRIKNPFDQDQPKLERTFNDDWDQGFPGHSRISFNGPNHPPDPKQKTLFDYVQEKNVEEVQKILDGKPHLLNSRQMNSKTPFETAMDADSAEIVRLLLQRGANVHLDSTARGRLSLLELAQHQDANGFWKIMDIYDRTLWTPGSDPDLMQKEKEYDRDVKAAAEMRKLEKNQVSTFLKALGQDHNIPLAENHELELDDFKRLMEEDLKAIGIESKEDIQKILEELKALNAKKGKSNIMASPQAFSVIQSSEAIGVLNNLTSHAHSLSMILNATKNRIKADPRGLRKNLEKAHLMDLNSKMEGMFTELDLFLDDVNELDRVIAMMNPDSSTAAVEVNEKKSESDRLKCTTDANKDAGRLKLQDEEDEDIKMYEARKRKMMYIGGFFVGGYGVAWGLYYYYYFVKK